VYELTRPGTAAANTTTYGYNADGLRMCKYADSSSQPCSAVGAPSSYGILPVRCPCCSRTGSTAYVYGQAGRCRIVRAGSCTAAP